MTSVATDSPVEKIIYQCNKLNKLAQSLEAQCEEEKNILESQKSQVEKMIEQFGKVLAFQYQKILVSLETK